MEYDDVWSESVGKEKQEILEVVKCKYLKWVIELNKNTPGYMVLEEKRRDKLKVKAGKRAVTFKD